MTTQLNQIAAQHHVAELHRQAAVARMTRRGEPRGRTRLVLFAARLVAYGVSSRTSSPAGLSESMRATDSPA